MICNDKSSADFIEMIDENAHPNASFGANHWRSPLKPESKEHIANLPLPPLEAMLAAAGDAPTVRLVCRRCGATASFLNLARSPQRGAGGAPRGR